MSDLTDAAASTDPRAATMAAVVRCLGVRRAHETGGVR